MKVPINCITRIVGKALLKVQKHSPEILMVAGAVGAVASGVMACKATLKVNEILDETKDTVDKIHEAAETLPTEQYSEEDCKKDLTITYVQTGLKFAKLYGPSVLVGALSIGAMVSSNLILRKRNIALAAAYAVVDKGFKQYRSNVIERFGEKVDQELKNNIKAKIIEVVDVDENGNSTVTKEEVNICDGPSEFARYFDESSSVFRNSNEHNLAFLRDQEQYANMKLKAQGYLFLNEVYRALDIPETKAGQIVGWIYDEKNPIGDNHIDFDIYNVNRQDNRDFVNGYGKAILLDFNVDGNILEYI